MQKVFHVLVLLILSALLGSCQAQHKQDSPKSMIFEVEMSEADWLEKLGEKTYHVLREKGTERPFANKYWAHKGKGIYCCAGCEQPLFDSKTKYRSGTGWPSFYEAIHEKAVIVEVDNSHGMVRKELLCSRCGGHLGHLFSDGPKPTGLRYCINSLSLEFVEKESITRE